MEVFTNVVDAGGFSKAAKRLDLAVSSVSACISTLEAHLSTTLIRRTTRQLVLTEEGETFYERAQQILRQVQEAQAVATAGGRMSGTLRIAMPIGIGQAVFAPVVTDFAMDHPDLKVVAVLTNEPDAYVKDGIDVAICMDEVKQGDLLARWLFETQHILFAAPALLERMGPLEHPSQLDPRLCLGFQPGFWGAPRRWRLERNDQRVEIIPSSNLCFNATGALMRSATRGAGVIYVIGSLAREYVERGELVPLFEEWSTLKQTFYAVYSQSRFLRPQLRSFLDFLSGAFRDKPDRSSKRMPRLAR